MEKIKRGDIVAKKSSNSNILYSVEKITKDLNGRNMAILKGIIVRIVEATYLDNLIIIDNDKLDDSLRSLDVKIEDRINSFLKKEKGKNKEKERNFQNINSGKILHLDGDKLYSEKSLRYYKKMGLNAIVKNVPENKQHLLVKDYINKYNPDILVLTGHDGMIKTGIKYGDINNYRNSKYFAQGVLEARKIYPSSNRLAIFARCMSKFF